MPAWTKTVARFEAALVQLEAKGVTNPLPWTETNLFDALGALTPKRFAETDAALDRLARIPTPSEVADIKWMREQLTVVEFRERFEKVKQRLA